MQEGFSCKTTHTTTIIELIRLAEKSQYTHTMTLNIVWMNQFIQEVITISG